MMTYDKCIPLISELDHPDKLRLAQWLIRQIALDEGIEESSQVQTHNQATGLCGIWQDTRNSDEISQEIINSRSNSRDINL